MYVQKVYLPSSFTKCIENCGLPDFVTDYQIRHLGNPFGIPYILLKIDPWTPSEMDTIHNGKRSKRQQPEWWHVKTSRWQTQSKRWQNVLLCWLMVVAVWRKKNCGFHQWLLPFWLDMSPFWLCLSLFHIVAVLWFWLFPLYLTFMIDHFNDAS